jgi:excisionase family DNA binding protein
MVASAWSRQQAEQAAAEKAAARAAKPKRKPAARRPSGQLKTVDQLAELLQVSRSTIYRLIEDKAMPCVRIGFVLRFDVDEVMAWARAFSTSGDKLRWQDSQPSLSSRRTPTADLPPSHQRTTTAALPPGRRGAAVTRRPNLRARRINPEVEGGADAAS